MARRYYNRNYGGYGGGQDSDAGYLLFVVALAVIIGVVVLLWLANVSFWFGLGLMVLAPLVYLAFKDTEGNAAGIAVIVFGLGLLLFLFAVGTMHFFDIDPLGMDLKNFSDSGINGMKNWWNGVTK